MFAPSSPSEPIPVGDTQPRVQGGVRVTFRQREGVTAAYDCEERDGYKIRFPRGSVCCEGVIINTGGGVAAGDRVGHSVTLENRASVTLTTPAAERIYRSHNGDASQIGISIQLEEGSSFAWLPQETILYTQANLTRRFEIDMDYSASLLMVEITVFGRKEMGEVVTQGRYEDHWRVRRNGTLAFAESVHFAGDLDAALKRPAIGNGARICGTVLYVAETAEDKLQPVRHVIRAAASRIAASAWNGLLCIRCLGADIEGVRQDIAHALSALREQPMPRVWYT